MQLKTGGPSMTVNRILNDLYECVWITATGEPQKALLSEAAILPAFLELIKGREAGTDRQP